MKAESLGPSGMTWITPYIARALDDEMDQPKRLRQHWRLLGEDKHLRRKVMAREIWLVKGMERGRRNIFFLVGINEAVQEKRRAITPSRHYFAANSPSFFLAP